MLSYQHAYHAGNMADIHKHEWLARVLSAMVQKDKPLTYIETHAGRGLYNLSSAEALKTGEAKAGILQKNLSDYHPSYQSVIQSVRSTYGADFYPGSPMIAQQILRGCDRLHLCELHPQEYAHLEKAMGNDRRITFHHADGYKRGAALSPPTPRRGIMMIDPSYEVKAEYESIPAFIARIHKQWNIGVIMVWYPILSSQAHIPMIESIDSMQLTKIYKNEIMFDTGIENHRLKGSGLYMINTPYGII